MGDSELVEFIKIESRDATVDPTEDEDNFEWNHVKIKLLLQCYLDRRDQFKDSNVKKKFLWAEIKSVFQAHGYAASAYVLDCKFRNLKKTFRIAYKNADCGRIRWPYFEDFMKIYGDDEIDDPPHPKKKKPNKDPSDSESEHIFIKTEKKKTAKAINPLSLVEGACLNPAISVPLIFAHEDDSIGSPFTTSRKFKRGKIHEDRFYDFKRRQQAVQKERLKELRELRKAVQESNRIQERRNELLEVYLKQLND